MRLLTICDGTFSSDKKQAKKGTAFTVPFHVVGENVTMIETKKIP
jgi:hypothetical protein